MIILTKPLVKKKAKKIYFLKWRFLKMCLSYQTVLTTHAISGKIFHFLKEYFFKKFQFFLPIRTGQGLFWLLSLKMSFYLSLNFL